MLLYERIRQKQKLQITVQYKHQQDVVMKCNAFSSPLTKYIDTVIHTVTVMQ